MVFKSFFDGGNEANSKQYDVVSLASVSGTGPQWNAFCRDWKSILQKNKDAPWLHTTDLLTFNEPYVGWTKTEAEAFLRDCVNVIEAHIMRPSRSRQVIRQGLIPHVVTINLKDYLRARAENPRVPKDANVLCAMQSISRVMIQGRLFGAKGFDLTFDQNEPFAGHIEDRKRNKQARRHLKDFINQIESIARANMRAVPALQMADLFAWCYSHAHIKKPRYTWKNRMLNQRWWIDDRYEYDSLVNVIPGVSELVESWSLPPRKPTR